MKTGLPALTILIFFTTAASVQAAASVNVNINNSANTTSTSQSNVSSAVKSTSTDNARVENHITVEVNGEKRVIDDVQEGSNINSNIKVQAKSENGATTFDISGNPQSVKAETNTASDDTTEATLSSQTQSNPNDDDTEDKPLASIWDRVASFFAGIVSFFQSF